ncbi:MAG: DUF4956 domain-containing protein [Pseudobutyrivibrio sp.]|nr:DUF4956 domain-containing protein [Pseudobutyrivibrio sp.]
MDEFVSLFTNSAAGAEITQTQAVIYSLVAGVLGLIISLTYMNTGKNSKNFARTLIILPILVSIVMIVVNGNLGTSLAVVGAFSLVRFRSLQGSSRDIGFIFFSMSIGIVCSVGLLPLAAILTLIICAIHFILNVCGYASLGAEEKDLKITIPENLDYSDIFDDIFDQFTVSHKMLIVRTTNMGSMYEINYRVRLKDDSKEKEFLDSIRTRNGNLTVICGRCDINEADEL